MIRSSNLIRYSTAIHPRFPQPLVPHTTQVTRLYRRALRSVADHYWQRAQQRQKQILVREKFDAYKHETNPEAIEMLIAQTEALLAEFAHFQPYVHPEAPGGSKWERNSPVPEEIIKGGVTMWDNSS